MDIARLGLVIDPTGAVKGKDAGVKAAQDLVKAMEDAAAKIAKATEGISSNSAKSGEGIKQAADKGGKGFATLASQAKAMAAGVGGAFQNIVSGAMMMRGGVMGAVAMVTSVLGGLVSSFAGVAKSIWAASKAGEGLRAIGMAAKAAAIGVGILTVAGGALLAIILPLVAAGIALKAAFELVSEGVALSAQMETYEIQFANLLGSFDKAQVRLAELANFANTTPFNMPEVVKAGITLEAMGRGALSSLESLRMVGDAAAKANVPFDDLAITIGRVYANLKAGASAGVELNRLSDVGLLAPDVKLALMDLSEQANEGGKNFGKLWAMVESELKKAKGSTELMALSFSGLVSTMSDSWDQLKRNIGEPFRDALKPMVADLTGIIDNLAAKALAIKPAIQAVLDQVVTTFRVMQQDGGFMTTMQAGWDTLQQAMERGMAVVGGLASDLFTRAVYELTVGMQKLTQAGFWKGLADSLYNAGVDFVNAILGGMDTMLAKADLIAKVMIPAYGVGSLLMGTGAPSFGQMQKRAAAALETGVAPPVRSPSEILAGLPAQQQTDAQRDFLARQQAEAARLAAERAAGKDNQKVALGAPTQIPADLMAQITKKEKKTDADKAYDSMKSEAERVISDIATPAEEMDKQLASLQKLKDAGLLTNEQFQRAIQKSKTDYESAMESMAKATESMAQKNQSAFQRMMGEWGNLKLQADNASVAIASSVADNLTNAFVSIIDGSKSASEAFDTMARAIVADILQITMRLLVQYAIQSAMGMVMGGAPAPVAAVAVHHAGGIVGDAAPRRSVAASAFAGARRYHGGGQIGGDEEPAILQKGETVLTRDQASDIKKRLGEGRDEQQSAPQQSVTILNVTDMREVESHLARNPQAILNVISKQAPKIRRMLDNGGK